MIDVTIAEYSSADFEALLNMSVDLYRDYSIEEAACLVGQHHQGAVVLD